MTPSTLIFTFLLCSAFVPSNGYNRTNLLAAFIRFSIDYENYQTSTASQSYNTYGSSNLASYLQQGQHGSSLNAENVSLASTYVQDLALLTNARTAASLRYPGEPAFNEFVDVSQNYVCQATNCSEIENSGIYRTMNGTCNNLGQPLWGAAFTAQQRYDDLRGSWERTSLLDYELDKEPGFFFDTTGIGAYPKFDERPFIFKVKGNSSFRISLFSTEAFKEQSDDIRCSGSPCRGYVPGSIFHIENRDQCEVNDEILFNEGSNAFEVKTNNCERRSYKVHYYEFLASVTLQPESSSDDNRLRVGNTETFSSDNKFPENDFSRYWMKVGGNPNDPTISISSGTEFIPNDIFLDDSLGLSSPLDHSQLFVSVGLEETSVSNAAVSVQFVNRDTYEVCTGGNEPMVEYGYLETLDSIDFTYDYYVFRWGVYSGSNGVFDVVLTSNEGKDITLHVDFGNLGSSDLSFSESAQEEVANYNNIQKVDFRTAAGKRFDDFEHVVGVTNGKRRCFVTGTQAHFLSMDGVRERNIITGSRAFYLAWYESYMYFGYGNQIARNLITTQALNMTGVSRFVVDTVTLSSDSVACWVVDIEQINQPRLHSLSTGEDLPTAVDVSMLLHHNEGETQFSTEVTLAIFQWGQFMDHIFIATPLATVDGHSPICCNNSQFITGNDYSEEFCFEIPINNNILDNNELGPFTTANGAECMDLVRSAHALPCDGPDDDFRVRQPMNAITMFIDGSNVYGSSIEEADLLRESGNAELHVQTNVFNNKPELPRATVEGEACAVSNVTRNMTIKGVTKEVTVDCNHAGDFRSQDQSSLAGMHTLWVREHNRLVNELRNQGYDDSTPEGREELFQVVRHIIGAMIQIITYRGWLPSFLSESTIADYQILDTICDYQPGLKAVMKALFGLIFRMGHTWIPNDLAGDVGILNHLKALDSLPLFQNFFNATPSYGNGSDLIMTNWIKACPFTDRIVEDAVVELLFGNLDGDFNNVALSLPALNTQRGRDHGVPTYKEIHKLFESDPDLIPQHIDDIFDLGLVDLETFDRLKRLYDSVEDIDAFSSGVMELPKDSTSHVGVTINNVLGDMFNVMRKSDRFWYACYFSDEARLELEKVTLGKVLCDNNHHFGLAQENIFHLPSSANPNVTCANRPTMNMSHFSKANNGGRNLQRFPNPPTTKKRENELRHLIDEIDHFLNNDF